MGCCGDKRREFTNSQGNRITESLTDTLETEAGKNQEPKEFEYTGNRSLRINGPATGNMYYFRFTGHKLLVNYEDSFAFLGESELKVVT